MGVFKALLFPVCESLNKSKLFQATAVIMVAALISNNSS